MLANKAEIKMFSKYILDANNYLEFGCGGSTFLLSYLSQASKIISVENDKNWANRIQENILLSKAIQAKRLEIFFVDLGKIKQAAYPIEESKKELFPTYSYNVFEKIERENINIDTIFVDGRFRVACATRALIYFAQHQNERQILIIHDFFNREWYHKILDFVEIIDRVDTLAIFKPKPNNDHVKLQALYDEFKYDAR